MGSKITRALNEKQRARPVDNDSVPALIKGFMVVLSLLSAFCLGFNENSTHYTERFDFWISRIVIFFGVASMVSFLRIDKLVVRTAIAMLISMLFGHFFEMVIVGGTLLLHMAIIAILYGQLTTKTPLFINLYLILYWLGSTVSQHVREKSKNPSSTAILILFSGILLMSIFLIVTSMFHTKTRHPLPLKFRNYGQLIKIHKDYLSYTTIIFLLVLGMNFPSSYKEYLRNQYYFGFASSILFAFLSIKWPQVKHLYAVLVCFLAVCLVYPLPVYPVFHALSCGWVICSLVESMRKQRILGITGSVLCFVAARVIAEESALVDYALYLRMVFVLFAAIIWLERHDLIFVNRRNPYRQVQNYGVSL